MKGTDTITLTGVELTRMLNRYSSLCCDMAELPTARDMADAASQEKLTAAMIARFELRGKLRSLSRAKNFVQRLDSEG